MIRFTTDLPEFAIDLQDVIRLFTGNTPISAEEGDVWLRHTHEERDGQWIETALCGDICEHYEEPVCHGSSVEQKRMLKRAAKTALFLLLRRLHGFTPPWGSLTGIRPTRLMYEAMAEGLSPAEAEQAIQARYFVSPEKAALLSEIVEMQRGVYAVPPDQFDLYIGIPFCTTRCLYCSFSSGEIGNGKRTEPYVQALLREIELCGKLMQETGHRVRAAYMGGGTPTAISADQLRRVLEAAQRCFPGAVEWTVEAGRPDTIDRSKLQVLQALHIDRISVNPQTFSDDTLRKIGRAHSAGDTIRAFWLAREMGFSHINMDLIAALPGETFSDFERSLDTCLALNPESITVHSLAVKRSSKLHEKIVTGGAAYLQADVPEAGRMISAAREKLRQADYHPYYLYRQKYMAGNLENVGYAKPGHACLYNIGNMEETARVLALGAGAISKWLFDRERRIERAPNLRNIDAYIDRVDEMVERKRRLICEDAGGCAQ